MAPGKERQWESLSFWLGCVMCEACKKASVEVDDDGSSPLPSFAWDLWLAVCNFLVLARPNLPMAVARLMPHLPTWVGRQLANASVQHPWPAHFR